ncbi:MAG: cell envelope integrity protein CreD [Chitinophaga sp.]|uniref:cell envelope integrity protein CreD n=1 Tax=Chitinophaga sp. TaxID=1869181 RepID=UPI0025BDE2C4|nr:cell envelope integrity protein CreD [Chitinophaga sp.]MBV8254986.1 cell envelope integrity protein CreD [Chitinophaga sp.]
MENTPFLSGFYARNAAAIKGAFVIFLILMLMIPIVMVRNLVRERRYTRNEAAEKIAASWGGEQQVSGPVIAIPMDTKEGETWVWLMPRHLKVNGDLVPSTLKRGIYNVNVYQTKLHLSGDFSLEDLHSLDLSSSAIHLERALLVVNISDLNGITSQAQVLWNGKSLLFNPGVPGVGNSEDKTPSGLQVPVSLNLEPTGSATNSFTMDLDLRGASHIGFSPVGKSTEVSLSSSWNSPSFDDGISPYDRKVTNAGFTATWKVQDFNRGFPQSWIGNKYSLKTGTFGVALITPIDTYQQSDRAVNYSFLIIGLTFCIYFFVEIAQRRSIHPIQYGLIGIALCIFYVLLLSISEQASFMVAYITASVMTIGLIGCYTTAVLNRKTALGITAVLALFYTFIYVVISAEDYALLMGSFGLFFTVAGIMYYSRKINWNRTPAVLTTAAEN